MRESFPCTTHHITPRNTTSNPQVLHLEFPRACQEMESSLPSQGMDEDEEWSGSLCLDQEYAPLKEKVVHMEQVILRVIGFDLELNHPFRYLLHYGHALRCSQPVIQQAYAITVDALWSPACMSLPPHHIAGGALYLAKRWKRDASLCPPPNTPGEVAGGSAKQAETRFRRESWWEWLGIPTADCERACQHLMDAIEDSFKHRSAHGDGSGRSLNGTDGLKHGAGSVISAASGVTGIGNGSMQQQQQQQQQKQKQQAMDARAKTAAEYFKTRFVTHGSHAGADEPKPVEIASDPSTLGHATLAQARDPPSQPPGKGSPEALLSRNGTDDTESDTGAPPSAKWVRLAPPASATRTRGNGPRASQSSSGASSTVGSLSSSIDAALSAAKSR